MVHQYNLYFVFEVPLHTKTSYWEASGGMSRRLNSWFLAVDCCFVAESCFVICPHDIRVMSAQECCSPLSVVGWSNKILIFEVLAFASIILHRRLTHKSARVVFPFLRSETKSSCQRRWRHTKSSTSLTLEAQPALQAGKFLSMRGRLLKYI